MSSPESDLIAGSIGAFQRSIDTNTAFCEVTLKEALQFTFKDDENAGAMVVLGAGLVCSQLDSVVSSSALTSFRQEDQAHTEAMTRLIVSGRPDQGQEYIGARYREIESNLRTRDPDLYIAMGRVVESLSDDLIRDDLIGTFRDSSLRAYRRFQLQQELGTVDIHTEESKDTNRLVPYVQKPTVLGAWFRIALNWRRFVDETFEGLVTDNPRWVDRLMKPMVAEEEGYENYVLYAALVGYCFQKEFRTLGRSFPKIDSEVDASSEAEFIHLLDSDPEQALGFVRAKKLRIFEEMGRPDQNPNLLGAISYLFEAQDLAVVGGEEAAAAHTGAYHAYTSIKNQLEADYWKEKISDS